MDLSFDSRVQVTKVFTYLVRVLARARHVKENFFFVINWYITFGHCVCQFGSIIIKLMK
jgi:hypothetical protein